MLLILATYRYGVVVMIEASTAMAIVCMFENAWYSRKLMDYPPWQQLWNTVPIVLATLFVSAVSYFAALPLKGIWPRTIVGCLVFGTLFLAVAFAAHLVPEEIVDVVKTRRIQHD